MKNKKIEFKTAEVVFLLVITSIFSTLTGYIVGNKSPFIKRNNYIEVDSKLQSFISEYNEIKSNYYGEFDEDEILSNALSAILISLGDTHSGMMETNPSNKDVVTLAGEYEGIGVEISNDKDYNIIVGAVYENTPAYKAGIKVGDQITKFNETNVVGLETSKFISLVKATDGELFKLELLRENNNLTVELKIEKIILKSVSSKIHDVEGKKIGYIYMNLFANNTYIQFQKVLKDFEKQGIDGLIIDVRDNPGGYLLTATSISDLFLDKSKIVYQTKSKDEIKKYYSNGNKNFDKKIVVLINENSASASELLASTLNENLNAILIGQKSFGKGTIQDLGTFGNTQYKYTTKLWLTPKGNSIDGIGIGPNIIEEVSDEYLKNPTLENDNQFQKALEQFK